MDDTLTLEDVHTVPPSTGMCARTAEFSARCSLDGAGGRRGQRGRCFVGARVDNQIVLRSYGRSSGFRVDPVEKKPLNHFLPGCVALSFGTAAAFALRALLHWARRHDLAPRSGTRQPLPVVPATPIG